MTKTAICVWLGGVCLLGGVLLAQEPSSKPAATQPSPARQALQAMRNLMVLPRVETREQAKAELSKRMPRVVAGLAEMEKRYPDSKEIHEARMLGLMASIQLARINNDPLSATTAERVGRKVLASDAPPSTKLYAEAHLLLLVVRPVSPSAPRPPKKPAQMVRDLVGRYDKGTTAPEAYGLGMKLAKQIRDRPLFLELQEAFLKKHPDHPAARQILRSQGKSPDVGKPFKATLTKVDGSKLTLPDDLVGKVVVVDFWAVWCGPCVREVPHMKKLYAEYKGRGVEFVGISLDGELAVVKQFVQAQEMGWIHTFSGKKWQDPTVRMYGVGAIPSIWVVGKDGKVVSDDARASLSSTIVRALSAPAPTTRKAQTGT